MGVRSIKTARKESAMSDRLKIEVPEIVNVAIHKAGVEGEDPPTVPFRASEMPASMVEFLWAYGCTQWANDKGAKLKGTAALQVARDRYTTGVKTGVMRLAGGGGATLDPTFKMARGMVLTRLARKGIKVGKVPTAAVLKAVCKARGLDHDKVMSLAAKRIKEDAAFTF